MRTLIQIIVALCFSHCIYGAQVWPQPQGLTAGSSVLAVSPSEFTMSCVGTSCSNVLKSALLRYANLVFFAGQGQPLDGPVLLGLDVNASAATALEIGADESYTLSVGNATGRALLTANTEWGALRGLETFSQLIDYNAQGQYFVNGTPVFISDFPRFQWRGLLIDSARHYLPVRKILNIIDTMTYDKLNILHWHVVDDESFPIVSQTYPLLSKKGAWAPKAVYSAEDVNRIVQHAYERGITVVPEFDTPGHASSWGYAYPSLLANCPNATFKPVMNPTLESTYDFLTAFFTEMSTLFPSAYIHLGGDEVRWLCWQQDPTIATWMAAHGMTDYVQLYGYYEQRLENILASLGKSAGFWDSVYTVQQFNLRPTSMLTVASPQSVVVNASRDSVNNVWCLPFYLDRQNPDNVNNYLFEDIWKQMYMADPVGNISFTPKELSHVWGGEAQMWGEQVDETCFDTRVWPRASAFAERMWSAQIVNNVPAATPRLGAQRCRMVRRGVQAGPIYPDYCIEGSVGG
eukprot:TRINITY_DN24270_c0_g1_i1.p1 TRINITY_DN24270_c0_g1~~TRINITY_DN24270_c0_g1_i1.p1  ORF type:complete len:518 (+),score=117.10 TRINITY_DN24270_c0_g1_i1:118-1671(+)